MRSIFLPTSFVRWYQKTYHRVLTPAQRAIIDSLERQRIASGRNVVLAAINDPTRCHTIILSAYAIWFQQTFCPHLDSIIFAPETTFEAANKYRFLEENLTGLTIRTCRQKAHHPSDPIGIAIMFGADLYCPSYPNWRRPRIHTFLQWVAPSMPARNHLILIIGDATHRRTAFADAFTGRIRRTRHPNIHCFRPRQIALAAYKKIDPTASTAGVENPRSITSPPSWGGGFQPPQIAWGEGQPPQIAWGEGQPPQIEAEPPVQWRGFSRASSPLLAKLA